MSYHHLSTFDRAHIQLLNNLGYSTREIGIKLGRHHSSIARELVRNNTTGDSQAEDAHSQYCQLRACSKPYGKCDKAIIDVITEKLSLTWSPEQIANTILFGKISFKTIYNWIYQGKLSVVEKVLRHKGKRHQPAEKRGKSKGCFATFVERKSRLYTAIKIPDRTANSMENAIRYLWNVLLREFYPKKTDLSLVHEQDLMSKLFLINSRPRKCLDWKSPIDIFLHEVSHLN
jgi:IS30 family transposase